MADMHTHDPDRIASDAARTRAMRSLIDTEHFRYGRFGSGEPADDEVLLSSAWGLVLETESTPAVERMVADFRSFCSRCLELSFADRPGPALTWRTTGDDPASKNTDRQDPSIESFTLTVEDEAILIEAGHQRGLLHATHYLERLMADRGAPILEKQRIERAPRFTPRITNSIFIDAHQEVGDPSPFSDETLGLMSHFGNNGVHLFTILWDVCHSAIFPELNTPDFDARIEGLNRLCARANAHGIDIYLCLVTKLPPDDAFFRSHPETRGARIELLESEVERHCLCGSNDTVLDFYEESIKNLLQAAPDVAGLMLLVGGEGFVHCYTRPRAPYSGRSNCPHCRDLDPSTVVANLVNRAAAAVKDTGRHKSLYAWPYSAFTWSGNDDRVQCAWLDLLSQDVSVLSNFAGCSPDLANGEGIYFYDYNIRTIGPGDIFAAQHERLQRAGKPIYAKVETNATPMFFSTPYLPLHQRWHRRGQAMATLPVAGFVGQWRFYGMNGSPPEELQYHATWNPERSTDDLLLGIARRDFELNEAHARQVVQGWQRLSDAWDDLPLSHLLCGERAFYMRGPMYLGPAHPLIVNPQNDYGLGPKFRDLRADIAESRSPEEAAALARNAPPRYVDLLMMVMPYGEDRFCELIARSREQWEAGLATLRGVLESAGTLRARMELDVCETVGIHLAAVDHVARFYRVRDRLWRDRIDRDQLVDAFAQLAEIARAEIENARRILPIFDRDPRIAYNHCYGNPYDEEMVRAKIRQCEWVVDTELPRLSRELRFHLWADFP